MRIERRLRQPWWLTVVVPVLSIGVAFVLSAFVLLLTGHPPLRSFHRLFDAAFTGKGALSETIVSATPLIFTGLAEAPRLGAEIEQLLHRVLRDVATS